MKLLKRDIGRDGSGVAVLIPEESEDLWHLYNLVSTGDEVTAASLRKVQREGQTGSVFTEMKKVTLTLVVKSSDYDVSGNLIRFSGQNRTETPYLKIGQFHTHEIGLGCKIALAKNEWDFIARQKLREACDPKTNAETVIILIDFGIANMYLLTASLTKDLCRIQANIPKKRASSSGYDKALNKFFHLVLDAINQHIDFDIVKCVAIAGPGFLPNDFFKWMTAEAVRQGFSNIVSHQNIFFSCRASTAHKQSLNEVLANESLIKRIANTKASSHVLALEQFYQALHHDPERTCYGPIHVASAIDKGAVKVLMVTDSLFRSADISLRRHYAKLTETAKKNGAEILIFSDMHVSGEQLQQLTGIAAILRFPLPELDELDMLAEPVISEMKSSSSSSSSSSCS